MNVCEIYGFNGNSYGVADLSDPDLAKRDRALENEIGWLVRTLERYENFCDAIDLSALGEHAVERLHDTGATLDWTLIEPGRSTTRFWLKSTSDAKRMRHRLTTRNASTRPTGYSTTDGCGGPLFHRVPARLARNGPALRPPLATHRPVKRRSGHRARPGAAAAGENSLSNLPSLSGGTASVKDSRVPPFCFAKSLPLPPLARPLRGP